MIPWNHKELVVLLLIARCIDLAVLRGELFAGIEVFSFCYANWVFAQQVVKLQGEIIEKLRG